ncbi:MAG: hypothetical protein NZL89_02730 [Leptospiraceae bacterium]|nr:hypothetical protein [Leptospiraceae bacterium]
MQLMAVASVATALYLNVLMVPAGHIVFLQMIAEAAEKPAYIPYPPGYHFVWTLFVPGRWRRYQLEVAPRIQEISVRLPLRYSAYLRLNDLFYIRIRFRVTGKIEPQRAVAALEALQLRPTARDQFIEECFQLLLAEYYTGLAIDERKLGELRVRLANFLHNNNRDELQRRLDAILRDNWYRLENIELRELYVPDSELYLAQTRNLEEVAAADRKALLAQIAKESELAIERKRNQEQLAKAEKMAELIADNPAILEYYKIEKIVPQAAQVILDTAPRSEDRHSGSLPGMQKKPRRSNDGSEEEGGALRGKEERR